MGQHCCVCPASEPGSKSSFLNSYTLWLDRFSPCGSSRTIYAAFSTARLHLDCQHSQTLMNMSMGAIMEVPACCRSICLSAALKVLPQSQHWVDNMARTFVSQRASASQVIIYSSTIPSLEARPWTSLAWISQLHYSCHSACTTEVSHHLSAKPCQTAKEGLEDTRVFTSPWQMRSFKP